MDTYEAALDRLMTEQFSHRGETRAQLLDRLRREEAPGSLPDLAQRRASYDAERARHTTPRGTTR